MQTVRRLLPQLIGAVAWYACAALIAAIMVGPFLAMFSQSLKTPSEASTYPFKWIPTSISFENYERLLRTSALPRWFLNSVIIATVGMTQQLITCTIAGYAFARKQFPGRDAIFWLAMSMMMIPFQVTMIPMYILFALLRLVNTYWAFFIPAISGIFGTFLMRQSIMGIPRDYDDAARVDGCSELGVIWHVIVPMCRPALAVFGVYQFILHWNEYLWALLVVTSNDMKPLTLGLATIQSQYTTPSEIMAAATLMFVPTLLILIVLQRYIIRGVVLAGIK